MKSLKIGEYNLKLMRDNKMYKKILIAVSNHPPEQWGDEQKAGWDEIVFIPFPNVPARLTRQEVREMAYDLACQIIKIWDEKTRGGEIVYLWLAGEYSLTVFTIEQLLEYFPQHGYHLFNRMVFPTSERVVYEEKDEEGNVIKKSVFKFVQWR